MRYVSNFGVPGLYRALPADVRAKLDAVGAVQAYAAGQHIQTRGDRTQGFSIIKSGSVCFGKNDLNGRFITSAVFEADQCYGELTLFADLPRTHDGFAVGETSICHISKANFDRLLAGEPQLAGPLLANMTLRLHALLEWLDDLRRYPLKFRLGKQLLQMAQVDLHVDLHVDRRAGTDVHTVESAAEGTQESKIDRTAEKTIEITQTELADLMGVSRVAISKILSDYRRRGFIAVNYGGIVILNGHAFQNWLQEFVQLDPVSPPGL